MSDNEFLPFLEHFLGKSYPAEQIELLKLYLSSLSKWNKSYNLTSITIPKEMVIRHILDSLALSPYIKGQNIIDVGTGAGLPGIPLAITHSDKRFTLLESSGKKVHFLNHVKMELRLHNIDVIQERVESYHPEHCFDAILSRAFSSLDKMLALSKHLCCPDGSFLAMKGEFPQAELNALPSDFTIHEIIELKVPHLDAKRHLVCVKLK